MRGPWGQTEFQVILKLGKRGCPFEASWSNRIVRRLGLEMTLSPLGRPKKEHNGSDTFRLRFLLLSPHTLSRRAGCKD